jgi:hypothetical protein
MAKGKACETSPLKIFSASGETKLRITGAIVSPADTIVNSPGLVAPGPFDSLAIGRYYLPHRIERPI